MGTGKLNTGGDYDGVTCHPGEIEILLVAGINTGPVGQLHRMRTLPTFLCL